MKREKNHFAFNACTFECNGRPGQPPDGGWRAQQVLHAEGLIIMTWRCAQITSDARVLEAVDAVVAGGGDARMMMDGVVDVLKERVPHYTWVGIYLLEGNELVLGPFRGKPSPHTRIPLGRGICGAAATEKATIIVDDVNADPRYLACSIETRSEIVVPIMLRRRRARRDRHRQRPAGGVRPDDRELLEARSLRCSSRRVADRKSRTAED